MPLCYKDRAFCSHTKCDQTDCYRFCSKQTMLDAEDFNLPIAYMYFTECPHFPTKEHDQ